ncbi:MAG: hypothetical protein NT109_10355 [Flavobacteriia bacterium]|nr:hypothetical protein [Flavobacteriia bacterium]
MSDSYFHKSLSFSGHTGPVYAIAEDDSFIYSASGDKFIARWSKKLGIQDSFSIKLPDTPFSIGLIDTCKKLVVGLQSGALLVFDLEKRIEIQSLREHNAGVFAICEHRINAQFYSADANGTICIWDSLTFNLLLKIPTNAGKIRRIVLNRDESSFVICCEDGTLRTFDCISFNEYATFGRHIMGATSFCSYSELFSISGGKDAHLCIWNKVSNELIYKFPAHLYVIYDIISLLDGQIVVSASRDKSIKIWDTKTWTLIQKIESKQGGHRFSVNALMKQNEHSFVSCSDDHSILCWSFNKVL